MKKFLSLLLAAALALGCMTGCSGSKGGTVSTDGSTSMSRVIGALGEAFEAQTGTKVSYNPTGSGSGIQAVQEGRCDIGLSSRALKADELAAGLTETTLAYDGIESITGTNDACKYRQELISTGGVITTVSGNPNAIGYASLATVKDSVKLLSVDGVMPSEETIRNGSCTVQRPFILVTRTDEALSETAQKFFDYRHSAGASKPRL